MKDKRKLLKVVGVALMLALLALGAFFALTDTRQESSQRNISVLTGKDVSEDEANRPILGIMVENSPAARPQTGLSAAGVVFEAVTEGGITRFLALYQEEMPETVAPVRSLRPVFLDWAMGFNASITHVGGSTVALDQVDQRSRAKSLNQFEYQEPYFRTNDREAPHNMSARIQSLRYLQEELNHELGDVESFAWSDTAKASAPEPTITNIAVNFSSPNYATEYIYSSESNTYKRVQAGEPHIDAATNQQITVTNVVVLEAPSRSLAATGGGKVTIFRDGLAFEGRWDKKEYDDRLRFLNNDGSEITLNRGVTWIALLPQDGELVY